MCAFLLKRTSSHLEEKAGQASKSVTIAVKGKT